VGALYGGWRGRRGTLIKRIQRPVRSIVAAILIAMAMTVVPRPAPAGDDPLAEAAALQNQVATLFQQGRYGEIEPLLKRLIAIGEEQAGANSPQVADSLGFLADFYEIQGRYDAAEPIYRRVLAIREIAPGQDRLDLGGALNGLAGLYKLEGRYAEAENFYRRALEIVEAATAPPAASVATILSNLALIYQNEGRYDEAEPLYRRAMTVAGENPETDRLLGPVIRTIWRGSSRRSAATPTRSRFTPACCACARRGRRRRSTSPSASTTSLRSMMRRANTPTRNRFINEP
jgi:tetratricopeptide (TPR) repeat protein